LTSSAGGSDDGGAPPLEDPPPDEPPAREITWLRSKIIAASSQAQLNNQDIIAMVVSFQMNIG
jgi:hypothetical protein